MISVSEHPARKQRNKARGNSEGTYFQRADGAYVSQITVRDEGRCVRGRPKRITHSAADAREAEEFKRGAAAGAVSTGRQNVRSYLEEWLRLGCPGGTKSRKSDKTSENYTHIVNGYLIPELGTKPIARLSANDVDQALRRLAGSGLSRNTLRLCRTVLSLALGYAERRGLISRNPAKGAPLPDAPERK